MLAAQSRSLRIVTPPYLQGSGSRTPEVPKSTDIPVPSHILRDPYPSNAVCIPHSAIMLHCVGVKAVYVSSTTQLFSICSLCLVECEDVSPWMGREGASHTVCL